jgi:hypothetical protein
VVLIDPAFLEPILDYLVKAIPVWFWETAKLTADNEGISLRQLIFKSVAGYCNKSET